MRFLYRHWYDDQLLDRCDRSWHAIHVLERLQRRPALCESPTEEFGCPGGFGKLANTLYYPDGSGRIAIR